MIDGARGRDDHVRRPVVGVEVAPDRHAIEARDRLRRAEDATPYRLTGEGRLAEQVEDEVVGRVLDGTDLLEDDVLLAHQLALVEDGIGQDVREDVEAQHDVVLEDSGVIGRVLDRGRRVELASSGLDLLRDATGIAPPGALEGHVLEKVSEPMLALLLRTRAGSGPDPERCGFEMGDCVGDDREPRSELRDLDAHAAATFAARERPLTNASTRAWSFASAMTRSGRSRRSARWAGSAGLTPEAASTASGNLAGWAVPRATMGMAGSRRLFPAAA